MKISIIGAGSFGTAIAFLLAGKGHEVAIWAREAEIVDGINQKMRNPTYLPDLRLTGKIRADYKVEEVLKSAELVVFATPTHALREVATAGRSFLRGEEILVSVAKGIEQETLLTPSQILVQVLEGRVLKEQIGVITGPSHAEEVASLKPTTVVASAYSRRIAGMIQETFMTPMFRVYLNHDIIGTEIGGAVKNVMAIAAGIVDGAELGDNAKAALITRGLHEMKRMGSALGASQDTFSGLTGMGDLIVTCTSEHSRNRFVGYNIGRGKTLDEITRNMTMVAEGVRTTRSVFQWAEKNGVEMPITEAVYRVLFEGLDPADAVQNLMTREAKEEILI
ncbi:MAG: NAD(P)H-dependent glycerol-3-phosphate dehydrogenase [Balneolaceae bacterium]|nr:MAG: NAD(P)H-dependent glycerol-3-phosphate dehydrogenase [Balneolaceae bacterium]